MIPLSKEWELRRAILDEALRVLSTGEPTRARKIAESLEKKGLKIPKQLVNSVLFSEGKRYVTYDRKSFTYSLRFVEEIDPNVEGLPDFDHDDDINTLNSNRIRRKEFHSRCNGSVASPAFFDVQSKGGHIAIRLNENHLIHEHLNTALNNRNGNSSNGNSKQGFNNASECIDLLLAAWAKYESDQPNGPRKRQAEDARLDWGRAARDLLLDEEDI